MENAFMEVHVLHSMHIQDRLEGKKTGYEVQEKTAVGKTLLNNLLLLGWGKKLVKMGCKAKLTFKLFVLFQSSISGVRCIKGFNSTVSVRVAVKIFFLKKKRICCSFLGRKRYSEMLT